MDKDDHLVHKVTAAAILETLGTIFPINDPINIDMLMTNGLLVFFMYLKRFKMGAIVLFAFVYFSIKLVFLVVNLGGFLHGGWISILLSAFLKAMMLIWFQALKIRNRYVEFVKLLDYLPRLEI